MKRCVSLLPQLNLIPRLPKNPQQFHIVVIGAGAIVNLGHLPAYRNAGFTVNGIFDIDRSRAEKTAAKWQIPRVFQTMAEACGYRHPEKTTIFDLAVPSKEVISILEKLPINSYVLIQKPMGESLSEAQAIVDMCEQRQSHASINFQLRYAPYMLAMKDAIQRGWLGDRLTTIEVHINVLMPWASWPS